MSPLQRRGVSWRFIFSRANRLDIFKPTTSGQSHLEFPPDSRSAAVFDLGAGVSKNLEPQMDADERK
jgi:hypothetical protein